MDFFKSWDWWTLTVSATISYAIYMGSGMSRRDVPWALALLVLTAVSILHAGWVAGLATFGIASSFGVLLSPRFHKGQLTQYGVLYVISEEESRKSSL